MLLGNILVYFLIIMIWFLILGLTRPFKTKKVKQHRYSIIIACRNEEKNLPTLFRSLETIAYPKALYEIILVNDASTDSTKKLLETFSQQYKNVHAYHLKKKSDEYRGKKSALKLAIEKSTFEQLIFTDADCEVPSTWLTSNNAHLKPKIDMVVGYSPEDNDNIFVHFMNKANGIIFGAPIGVGFPFSCSGRYFSLSRNAFDAVGGYDKIKHHISGDDKALLVLVKKAGFKINYNPDIKVKTKAVENNFKNQQKRRYSKINMSSLGYKIIQIILFIGYLYLPFSILVNTKLFIAYCLSTCILWILFCIRHHEKILFREFLFLLCWPYYVIYFGLSGILLKWNWK